MRKYGLIVLSLLTACAIQEMPVEYSEEEEITKEIFEPSLSHTQDTVVIYLVQGAIQSSYYYALRGLTEKRNGVFFIDVSSKELEELRIPQSIYNDYQEALKIINKHE